MKAGPLVARLAALGLVAGAAGLVYFAYAPFGDDAAHPFNHDRNAVWLEHRWLEQAHSVPEMEALFAGCRARDRLRLPHLIPFDAGPLPPHS